MYIVHTFKVREEAVECSEWKSAESRICMRVGGLCTGWMCCASLPLGWEIEEVIEERVVEDRIVECRSLSIPFTLCLLRMSCSSLLP